MSINLRPYVVAAAGFSAFFVIFFSPALLHGKYLTWGDGLTEGLPAYFASHSIWEPNIMLGDPWPSNLNGFWYPIEWVLKLFPNSFNAYMIAAYVMAAVGTFGLVRRLAASSLAGAVAALAYTLGGFMTSHSGHYNIVQPAAWTPFVLWSMAELRKQIRARWIVAGALSVAMCALAGQPQVLTYTLYLAAAFVVTISVRDPAWKRFAVFSLAALALGLLLAAVNFLPAAELARNSVRADVSFQNFIGYSEKPVEIPIRLLFPYFLGVTHAPVYPYSGIDFDTFTELSCYAGILTIVLTMIAILHAPRSRQVLFWTAVCVVALIASTGDYLHAGFLFYHLPLVGVYRAQGRHALEFTLAAAVLAGLGVAAIEQGRVPPRVVGWSLAIVGVVMAVTLVSIALLDTSFAAQIEQMTGTPFPLVFWRNPALGIPLLVLMIDAAALAVFCRLRSNPIASTLLLAAMVVDLGTFSWVALPFAQTSPAELQAPAYVAGLRTDLQRRRARVLSFSGSQPPMVLPPNISLLWNLPEAGGYVPLEPATLAGFLQMSPDGTVPTNLYARDSDAALNLASVAYVALPQQHPSLSASAPFGADRINVSVGAPGWGWSKTLTLRLPAAVFADRIALVSFLSDGTEIADRTHIANLSIAAENGRVIAVPILAGRDTSEIAYDMPAVRAVVRHKRAKVFSTVGVSFHDYVTEFHLPARTKVRSIEVRWLYPSPVHGYLTVSRLSLVDDVLGTARGMAPSDIFASDPSRWMKIGGTAPDVLFENRAVFPRAWIVHGVRRLSDADALTAIRRGTVDFRRFATVDSGSVLQPAVSPIASSDDVVSVKELLPTRMGLAVRCKTSCFVVTSDLFYPGWHAYVDARRVPIFRADYALRGIAVPPGDHRVSLVYLPRSIVIGAALSLLALAALVALCLTPVRTRLQL